MCVVRMWLCVCVTSVLQWRHEDERINLSGGGCVPHEMFRVVFCTCVCPFCGCIRATPSFLSVLTFFNVIILCGCPKSLILFFF